jgi:hypothetical protein
MGAGSDVPDQYSLPRNPVESTVLRLQSTDIRNGGTHGQLSSAVDPGSRVARMPAVGRMAQEANAGGNAPDMLTWARRVGRKRGE